jgi:hypothetical protein
MTVQYQPLLTPAAKCYAGHALALKHCRLHAQVFVYTCRTDELYAMLK